MYYLISLLSQIGIYIMLGISFNFALGFTGVINLSHISFFALGAYATALLYNYTGLLWVLALLGGGLVSSLVALFVMYACRKLRGDYLALGTLSFHFVIYSLIRNLEKTTGGTRGLIIKRPELIQNDVAFFVMVSLVTLLMLAAMYRVTRSPFGVLLGAVRDNDQLARSLGKNSQLLKVKALVLSAFGAGLAGGVLAFFLRYIHPDFFFLFELVTILTIVIMGGLASLRGTVVATFIVVLLPELLRFIALPSTILGPLRQILYSMILLAILLINSRGLFGKVDLH